MRARLASLLLCVPIASSCGDNRVSPDAAFLHDGPSPDSSLVHSPDASTTTGNVALTITNAPTDGSAYDFLVAYQDGSAAWKLAPAPTSGGAYSLPITTGRYGVTVTCAGSQGGNNQTYYLTLAHEPSLSITLDPHCTDVPVTTVQTVMYDGTITNTPMDVSVHLAGGQTSGTLAAGLQTWTDTLPASSTQDFIISHTPSDGVPDKILIDRGVAIGTVGATQNFDFSMATTPRTTAITFTNVPSNATLRTAVGLLTTNFSSATAFKSNQLDQSGSAGDVYSTFELAASDALSSDQYYTQVSYGNGTVSTVTRGATPPTTLALPAALTGVTVTIPTTTPYPVVNVAWTADAAANGFLISERNAACSASSSACVQWTTIASASWLDGATSVKTPDLSALTGFNTAVTFPTGNAITAEVDAATISTGESAFLALIATQVPALDETIGFSAGAGSATP